MISTSLTARRASRIISTLSTMEGVQTLPHTPTSRVSTSHQRDETLRTKVNTTGITVFGFSLTLNLNLSSVLIYQNFHFLFFFHTNANKTSMKPFQTSTTINHDTIILSFLTSTPIFFRIILILSIKFNRGYL